MARRGARRGARFVVTTSRCSRSTAVTMPATALPASRQRAHPQRVIDGLFGFEQRLGAFELPHGCRCLTRCLARPPPDDGERPADAAGAVLATTQKPPSPV